MLLAVDASTFLGALSTQRTSRVVRSSPIGWRAVQISWLVVLVIALVPASNALAWYDVTELATLDPGSTRVLHGVNDSGEGVGGSQLSKRPRAFITSRRGIEIITGVTGSDYAVAFGINNASAVVGASNASQALRAFRFTRGGGVVDLGTLP